MSLLVPNDSESIILQYIINNNTPEDLVVCLYANDVTPDEDSTVETFTEVTGSGYSPQKLIPRNWKVTSGKPSIAEYEEIVWTLTATIGAVYGYYIIRETGGELMWAEYFPKGPFMIKTNGDEIRVKPVITLG